MTVTMQQLERWIDRHVVDQHGSRIGTLADIYIDDATGRPEWLAVMTGLFGTRISFVPLTDAIQRDNDIVVPYEKALVKDTPNIEADGQLSQEEEERLYRHYGLTYNPAEAGLHQGIVDLQQSGSAVADFTTEDPQVARLRLRRRDADAVDAIDLLPEDAESVTPSKRR